MNRAVSIVLVGALSHCSRERTVEPAPDAASAPAPARVCLSASDPLLTFSVDGTHGALVSESLRIECSGDVRYEASARSGGSEVGRYGTKLSTERLALARALALEVYAEPERRASLPPQGADTSIVVHGKPDTRSWPLRPDASRAHGRAALLHTSLIEEARRSPGAALTFSARKQPLALVAAHRGTQPVRIQIDDLRVRVGSQRFEARSIVGFVDAKATGLGGRLTRATFTDGAIGAMVLETDAPTTSGAIVVEVSGQMWLPGDADGAPTSRALRVSVAAR